MMNESRPGDERGVVPDARRWASDHAPRAMDGQEVRETLFAAGRQAMHLVRDRPLVALGLIAAVAFVMGRANRGDSPHRRGIWF